MSLRLFALAENFHLRQLLLQVIKLYNHKKTAVCISILFGVTSSLAMSRTCGNLKPNFYGL